MNTKKLLMSTGAAAIIALSSVLPVVAASTVVVTPAHTQGWSTADTRPGGSVQFVNDSNAPDGTGALELRTDITTTAKAQYMHTTNTPLSDVTELSYSTKQISASFAEGDPSYQLPMYLNGGTNGFTTLVFEPYQNPTQGPVVTNTWQSWDVDSGFFWSSRTVTCSNGVVTGTAGGPATYTLTQIKTMCPDAVVIGFGVNIGSNNPSYTVRTDLVNFNGTSYNFEVTNVPTDKNQCKNGEYSNFTDNTGAPFKNQGQCVSFVQNQKPE